MEHKKTLTMISLLLLVLSGPVLINPQEGIGGEIALDGNKTGTIVPTVSKIGPQYGGSTLHVGSGQTYSNIQSALDGSIDGDIIVVHPGKYTENVVVGKAVHIRGMKGAIIEGSNLIAIRITTSNVTVTGMGINNSSNGVFSTSMGLNISDCNFYRNTLDVRFEVVNNTLTNDFLGYPLELINNTIDHASNSNMIDITLTLGSNWRPVNISIGSVMISRNRITNTLNRGYDVRIRETFSLVKDANILIGDIWALKNNFSSMDYGISLTRTLTDLEDMDVGIGGAYLEGNWVTNPRTQGIMITNTFSRWTGTTKGDLGPMVVRENRVVSTSFSTSGVTVNPVQFSQCTGMSSLTIGDIDISSNIVNVSSRAVYINTNQPMNSCSGNASLTVGEVSVRNNDVVSRGSIGVNYVLTTLSLNFNSTSRFGNVTFYGNKVVSSISQGITVTMTDITSSMSGNAAFGHGGFEFQNNRITSSSYSIYSTFTRVGKGASGYSKFSMGKVLVQGNILSGSNGVRVSMSDTLTNGDGRSIAALGDVELRSNTIKSTSQSLYLSLTNMVSHIKGNASASMGRVSMVENTLRSNTDGIYMTIDTICYDLTGGTTSEFGGLGVEGNTMSTVNYGVNAVRMRYLGENLYDNSSTEVGEVSVSGNDLTKGTGINIGIFSYLGFYLYGNSTFDMGGLRVNTNKVNSSSTGISLGQCSYLGSNVHDNASSRIGEMSIDGNVVSSSGIGITIPSPGIIACTLSGYSISSVGLLSVEDNNVTSGDIGINVGTFGPVGTELYGSSQSEMDGLSICGNHIISKGLGINLGSAYNLGSSLSGISRSEVGKVRISDNTVTSRSHGVYVETYQEVGSNNGGRSNSSIGGLEISSNTISSDGFGVFTGTPYIMGYMNTDDSWTEIGDISFSGNTIVSNGTGILVGFIGMVSYHLRGNATVRVGRFGFDGNTISSNASGIHLLDAMELSYLSYDNVTTHLDGLTLDDNTIDCRDSGILVPEVRLGLQMFGRSSTIVRQISSSRNRISSGGGLSIGVNVTEIQGNSSLSIGSLDLDGNVIEGSEGNGIALDLSFWTLENSTFTNGPPSISDNRLIDVNWSAVRVMRKVNISEDSTFTLGEMELVHNNISGCSIGLNLTSCGYVDAYLNNFIGNGADVVSDDGTSFTWNSPEKMWYRHKNANHSYFLGNYWDRYSGPDADDNGIGDVPYNTDYGLDLYPLSSNVDDHFPPWNDVTPPSVTILFPTNGSYLRHTEFTLSYSISDNLQGFREISVIVDGHLVGGRANWDLSDPDTVIRMSIIASEGVHTIEIRAVDMAGNENSTSSTFMVDITDPILTLVSPQEGAFLASNDIELVWEGSDIPSGLDRFEVRFGSWEWSNKGLVGNHTFSDVADGEHTVQVRVWDRAGNQRTVSARVVVDTIAPQLTILHPVQDHYYNSSRIEVSWMVVDMTEVTSALDLDGNGFTPLGSATQHALSGLVDGEHALTVRVTDGSLNRVEQRVSFTIDTKGPQASVLSPIRYVRSSDVVVVLKANGTGSPLGALSMSLNRGPWTIIDSPYVENDTLEFDMFGLEEGDHTVSFDLPDMAGNHWYNTTRFTIDTIRPTVLTASPLGTGVRTDSSISVEFSETMDPVLFELDMDVEGSLVWNARAITFEPYSRLSPDTVHRVYLKGSDLAGNPLLHSWEFTTASKGTIIGRILDEGGKSVTGASIVLDTGETTRTGIDGRFAIGASQGNRTVTVTYKGKVLDIFEVDITAGVETDVGDRVVQVPKGNDQRERSWTWLVILILAAVVLLLVILFLYFLLVRKGKEGVEDWGIDPDEWIEE
ncbi:MAG: Ig-like domain-containing protein [Candidatus Thermoplasmatota archaeon]|jgi:nitrous oxidase accessory protein NosD|nr:Ig-like domain-containing protein [Candidatus Thermoplasmatota archaeon]